MHRDRSSSPRARLGALALLGVLALGFAGASRAAVPEGSIDAFIEGALPATRAPGVAHAVVVDGELEAAGGHGVTLLGGGEAVTAQTPFVTGSISKSFTALAIMQLAEAGALDLDDAVAEHLDAFAGQPAGDATIRQLLSHTSGYSTMQGNSATGDAEGPLAVEVEALAARTPANAPGTTWAYSNANYQILGRVIEERSGQPYADYVASKILEPLGMAHSFAADGTAHPEVARGHLPWFGTKRPRPPYAFPTGSAPQGGIVASAEDLARYAQVMVNGQDDILSAKGKAAMLQPASEASPHYGFGWFLDPQNESAWHSGASPGTETLITLVPDTRSAAVVLINAGSGVGFGETAPLSLGITARALELDDDAQGGRWGAKLTFLLLALSPLAFLANTAWAWLGRDALRAKTDSAFGLFSLWFPLLSTIVVAALLTGLVPRMIGAPMATIRRFSPDLALSLVATAITGVTWALLRLSLAYTGQTPEAAHPTADP